MCTRENVHGGRREVPGHRALRGIRARFRWGAFPGRHIGRAEGEPRRGPWDADGRRRAKPSGGLRWNPDDSGGVADGQTPSPKAARGVRDP